MGAQDALALDSLPHFLQLDKKVNQSWYDTLS